MANKKKKEENVKSYKEMLSEFTSVLLFIFYLSFFFIKRRRMNCPVTTLQNISIKI